MTGTPTTGPSSAGSALERFLQLAGDFVGRGLHRALHDFGGLGERLVDSLFDGGLANREPSLVGGELLSRGLFTDMPPSRYAPGGQLTDHGHVLTDAPVPTSQPIVAVLADVDGTLVTGAKVLTTRAIEAVERLHERGVVFAITSGRPPRGMRMLVHPLELRGPIAAFNGGIIVRPDMSIIDERTIPADVTPAVIDAIRAGGLYAWIYRGTEWYVTDPHAPHAAREAATVQFQPTVVPSYDGLLDRVVKIVGVSDDLDLVARSEAALHQQFGAHVSAARSQPYYLDVTHPEANKGVVVERLSHYYQIPLEQIATIGDGANDVLMFQRSGLSIAMGNASEDVQRQATYVTTSNEDEGFARAVEEFILPRAVAAPVRPRAG